MIALIRIAGLVNMKTYLEETLSRLKVRRKYACVIVDEKRPEIMGMVIQVRNLVAYGKIDEATLTALLKARGKKIGDSKAKVENPEKVAKEILAGKSLEELGIKPFFRLHPARGGINNTKLHFPKGVLGDNKEAINKLISRML